MVCARNVRILPHNAYFGQNAFDIGLFRQFRIGFGRIQGIEYQAPKGAGETVKRKGTLMFSEKPPDLSPFPAPALTEVFKCQNCSVFTKLNCRC